MAPVGLRTVMCVRRRRRGVFLDEWLSVLQRRDKRCEGDTQLGHGRLFTTQSILQCGFLPRVEYET
jgi:hypothetical protein